MRFSVCVTITHVFEKTHSKTILNAAAVGEAGSPVSVDQDGMQRSPLLTYQVVNPVVDSFPW